MNIDDMEALIQITKEIEKQGYAVKSVNCEEQYSRRPTFDMTLKISRKRPVPEDNNPEYINLKPTVKNKPIEKKADSTLDRKRQKTFLQTFKDKTQRVGL